MNIELPQDLQEFVSDAIRKGIVKNESEAIVEALRLWRDIESDWTDEDEENLRQSVHQICDALDRGELRGRDASDVFAEIEQENAKHLGENRPS
jgi:Arc/MetJ-type ribon-helix-helix transcriptional regulator